jgi:pimeloyl-ACP methyl ester carboxylesterase
LGGSSNLGGQLHRGSLLWEAARSLTAEDVQVLVTLPYDTPEGATMAFTRCGQHVVACTAATQASDTAAFLAAIDPHGSAHVTVVAHSYGTTATGYAFLANSDLGRTIDDLVLVGSPGMPQGSADGYGDTTVWASCAGGDPVCGLGGGWHGNFVIPPEYGANVFDSGSGDHSSYFEGRGLQNIARIAVGLDGDVSRVSSGGAGGDGGGGGAW